MGDFHFVTEVWKNSHSKTSFWFFLNKFAYKNCGISQQRCHKGSVNTVTSSQCVYCLDWNSVCTIKRTSVCRKQYKGSYNRALPCPVKPCVSVVVHFPICRTVIGICITCCAMYRIYQQE